MTTLQRTMRTLSKDIRYKSVFELSAEELTERLRSTADALRLETFRRNGYITYYDQQVCPDTTYVVREYKDRKELVQVDNEGTARFVKTL